MERVVSCCGVECSACKFYPGECAGCPAIRGRVYWLQYVEDEVCPIYACCVEGKNHAHCGQCGAQPCEKYHLYSDPGMSEEEAAACEKGQMELLQSLLQEENKR